MSSKSRVLGFGSAGEDAALFRALAVSGVTLEPVLSPDVGATPDATAPLAAALLAAERTLAADPPDAVLLGGSGDEVLGACLAASKLELAIARIGAGVRGDHGINGRLIDRLADLLLCSGEAELDALRTEGLASQALVVTGADAAAARIAAWLSPASEDAVGATPSE